MGSHKLPGVIEGGREVWIIGGDVDPFSGSRDKEFITFFQGKREQGGPVGGTGIGLSVVLECIQAHDGMVDLVDSDEFSGAHFRIHIPQARATAQQKLAANA